MLGDYWWVSSPIPLVNAGKYNIKLADNIKNSMDDVKAEISQELFRIDKNHDHFTILTNDQSVAGYIFATLYPDRAWVCEYSIS